MQNLQVQLPDELRLEIARRAGPALETVSAWVAEAVRERLAACDELEYLQSRAARGSREAFERILAKVPPVPPMPGDER